MAKTGRNGVNIGFEEYLSSYMIPLSIHGAYIEHTLSIH